MSELLKADWRCGAIDCAIDVSEPSYVFCKRHNKMLPFWMRQLTKRGTVPLLALAKNIIAAKEGKITGAQAMAFNTYLAPNGATTVPFRESVLADWQIEILASLEKT